MPRVLRHRLLLLAALAPAPFALAQDPPLRAEYRVVVTDPADGRVDVELEIRDVPNYSGPLMLAMKSGFSLAQLPRPALLEPVRATDGAGSELRVITPRPYAWLVVRPEDGVLRLTWSIPTDLRTHPRVVAIGDSYEWPFVAEDHGLLHTANLLLIPVGPEVEARIDFALPEGWEVTSSWTRDERGGFVPPSHGSLENDYIAIGEWLGKRFEVDGLEVALVAPPGREEWLVLSERITRTVVPAEVELFGMEPAPRFLFIIEGPPQGAAPPDLFGSAKASSLVISVPERFEGGVLHDSLARVVAHEFFHTWGQARFEPRPELRWIQEGFCDYYAHLVAARTELLTWSDFSGELARAMADWTRVAETSAHTLESAGARDAFVHQPGARALVYRGGMVLAALCDRRIRLARPGSTLDDFMRALHNDPRWSPRGASPAPADVEATLASFIGEQGAHELMEMTRRRGTPDLVALFRAAGADVATERYPMKPVLDAVLEGTKVASVAPGSSAEAFGLRAGDELLVINGSSCRSAQDALRLWRSPRDGEMQCSLSRAGEPLEIKKPVPEEVLFLVDPRPWREHLPTSDPKSPEQD